MKRILVLFMTLYLFGCSGTGPMKPEDRLKIKTVTIDNNIAVIGPGIYRPDETTQEYKAHIPKDKKYFADNHIDVVKMFKQDFVAEVNSRHLFKVVSSGNADAVIHIEKIIYGYPQARVFNGSLVTPMFFVYMDIHDMNGRQLWKGIGQISVTTSYTKNVPLKVLLHEPSVAKKSMAHAARLVAKLIVAKIEGREVPKQELKSLK